MSEPTREEFDAKLMATEERLNGHLVAIDGKLDRLFDRVEVAVRESTAARQAALNIKWNILFTALGAVGLMYAAWALWAQGIEMMSALLGMKIGGQ